MMDCPCCLACNTTRAELEFKLQLAWRVVEQLADARQPVSGGLLCSPTGAEWLTSHSLIKVRRGGWMLEHTATKVAEVLARHRYHFLGGPPPRCGA